MALIRTFEPGSASEDECLAIAEELYKEAVTLLDAFNRKVAVEEPVTEKEAKVVAAELRAAKVLLLMERNRVAEERRKRTGLAGEIGFDLDAARDEIRRRLACLRAAGDGGEVPE